MDNFNKVIIWRSILSFIRKKKKKFKSQNNKETLLKREYGGGSMFEFRAKMTVVKKTANKRLVLLQFFVSDQFLQRDINNALYCVSIQL